MPIPNKTPRSAYKFSPLHFLLIPVKIVQVLMFVLLALVLTPLCTWPYKIGLSTQRAEALASFFRMLWSGGLFLCGFFYVIKGRQKYPKNRTVFYTCNHMSYLDPPGIIFASRGRVRPIGKHDIGKIPYFGWFYRNYVIMVDRDNPKSRLLTYRNMRRIADSGLPIAIFPEGRMNYTTNPLLPFQPGAFSAAMGGGHLIVPCAIKYSDVAMPFDKALLLQPAFILIKMGAPIDTKNYDKKDIEKLTDDVRKATLTLMETD